MKRNSIHAARISIIPERAAFDLIHRLGISRYSHGGYRVAFEDVSGRFE
jgi:hypothetical protein